MSKQINPDKYYGEDEKHTGQLRSQVKADLTRDAKVDDIRLRVPKGLKEEIQEHVVQIPKYQRRIGGEVKPNVNQWIVDLILDQLYK